MYKKGQNRGGHAPLPVHPQKHHKPYRIRHIGLFLSGVLITILSAFWIGYLVGQSDILTVSPPESSIDQAKIIKPVSKDIKSSLGFSLKYDPAVFSAEGETEAGQAVKSRDLKKNLSLSEVRLHPKGLSVVSQDTLSELKISENKALVSDFTPKSDADFAVKELSRSSDVIGSVKFQKVVYQQTPTFDSKAKPVFSVLWTGTSDGKQVQIYLQNLLSDHIPSIYGQVLATLSFTGQKDKVLSASIDTQAFDINKVSPAVVKIYRFVCGTLVFNDVRYGQDACDGATGSGFLVSSDGYIATSGHVVVLGAADILVNELLNNPDLLRQFTAAAGLTPQQSARSDVVASVLAKIYDLPSQKLRLENRREAIFTSLGNQPIDVDNQQKAKKAISMQDTDYIKKAELLAVNYQPKDLLVIEQKNQKGFSASDVALLKINIQDAPYIGLADSTKLTQNAPISLVGFPADADNQLTENSVIFPSVTNGTINSIRRANGSSSLLFQTDADASGGSSGGPAINQGGEAFGLVTYRFKSSDETDAAKSYIRDIADFKKLVDFKNISLKTNGSTQADWEAGLNLFGSQRYSKALAKFRQVQDSYPAHRLVSNYISQAQQAIKDGKDKKDPRYGVILVAVIGITGTLIASIATTMIIRHRRAHLDYKAEHLGKQSIIKPPAV